MWLGNGQDLCGDFVAIGKNCVLGIFRDANALAVESSLSFKEGDGKQETKVISNEEARSSPRIAAKLMLKALDVYYEEYGNTNLSESWIVPSYPPWPKDCWGLELGKMVWALGYAVSSPSNMNNLIPSSLLSPIKDLNILNDISNHSLLSNHHHNNIQPSHHDEGGGVDQHQHHRSETWYELFYDLVFVASALQLGLIIKYDHRPLGTLLYTMLYHHQYHYNYLIS